MLRRSSIAGRVLALPFLLAALLAALFAASPAAAVSVLDVSMSRAFGEARGLPQGFGPFVRSITDDRGAAAPENLVGELVEHLLERAPAPRVETHVDVPATLFLPGKADPQQWMATGTWARVTYDGFNYDYGYDPLSQTYDLLVSGYAVQGGILVQETVGVMAMPVPVGLQTGQVERVECWFRVSEHNLFPDEGVGITALEDDIEPSSSLNSHEARLLYEDARGFRGVAYALDHFVAGAHAIDLGSIAVDHFEGALTGKGWFGVGFAADGWDLSGSLGQMVYWRMSGGGGLPESARPFFRVVYNAPPGPFSLVEPDEGAVVTESRPMLRWTEAVDPNGDAPVQYRVKLSSTPDFAFPVEFSVLGQTEAQPPLALNAGTYYWKVDALDPKGALREGPARAFSVATPTAAPGAVTQASISCSPNPFNPRTEIRLEVPGAGPVLVEVLDARGRRVRELHQGWREAGVHTLVWDGTDHAGGPCASGVYQLRVRLADRQLVSRVALVR